MKPFFFILLPIAYLASPSQAQTVQITNPSVSVISTADGPSLEGRATVSWQHAWHNDKNHDAAWIFVRVQFSDGTTRPIRMGAGTPRAIATPGSSSVAPAFSIPSDSAGFFVYPGPEHNGPVQWTISFPLTAASIGRTNPASSNLSWAIHGIEMVYIPEGPFYVGDTSPEAKSYSAFFRSDADGQPAGLMHITSETAIPVGPNAGSLYYAARNYRGDAEGPIPATFPKGHRAFYMMKYELTQGQYATFLNSLGDAATAFRAGMAGRGYYANRGAIWLEDGRYVAESPDRPANFISWNDAMAFTDWAGLRPFTELEFTKAARGPEGPVGNDFPWGTASKDMLARHVNEAGDFAFHEGIELLDMTDENRAVYGASYYWVMDLAGGVWERMVTVGHPTGRAFTGTHGDGVLAGYGNATNEDWPKGYEGEEGFGFRGGGYYGVGLRHTDFNPHSPVAFRPFGSWAGNTRHRAYGYRAARTAEE